MAHFCLKNRFFVKLPERIDIFRKFAWKNRIFLAKLPEEIEIFRKFAWKNQKLLTRIHDPQISNQIDAGAGNTATDSFQLS